VLNGWVIYAAHICVLNKHKHLAFIEEGGWLSVIYLSILSMVLTYIFGKNHHYQIYQTSQLMKKFWGKFTHPFSSARLGLKIKYYYETAKPKVSQREEPLELATHSLE